MTPPRDQGSFEFDPAAGNVPASPDTSAWTYAQRMRHVVPPPKLLVSWEPFWPEFRMRLRAVLADRGLLLTGESGPVNPLWSEVFVLRPVAWRRIAFAVVLHAIVLPIFLATSNFWFSRPAVVAEEPFQHTTISYFPVSDYLPPVRSAAPKSKASRASKGDPEFAKQQIRSTPERPDNSTQTILNPPHPNILPHSADVPLPNLVINTPVLQSPPVTGLAPKLTVPDFTVTPVAPAPDVTQVRQAKLKEILKTDVIHPAPDVKRRHLTELDVMAETEPKLDAPSIPILPSREKMNTPEVGNVAPVAPPVSTADLSHGRQAAGQLMALSLRPSVAEKEIKVPDGSRKGVFEAGPTGRPGAAGTPEVASASGEKGAGGAGGEQPGSGAGKGATGATGANGSTAGGSGKDTGAGSPAGISITGGTLKPGDSAVVGAKRPAPDAPRQMAAVRPPADIPRPSSYPPPTEGKVEDRVFNGRKYYSLAINLPNLSSAGGSWIIRFAQKKDDHRAGDLTSPVAVTKVDPAYPSDLIDREVEGVVVLHAVIGADGRVSDISVLDGFNDQLDENAKKALSQWKFRPATRNGEPVDLEAVVQIPFKVRRRAW